MLNLLNPLSQDLVERWHKSHGRDDLCSSGNPGHVALGLVGSPLHSTASSGNPGHVALGLAGSPLHSTASSHKCTTDCVEQTVYMTRPT